MQLFVQVLQIYILWITKNDFWQLEDLYKY